MPTHSSPASPDANSYGAYKLVTERNVDGRVRARLTTYQLANQDDGSTLVIPEDVAVAGDGKVLRKAVHYRPHVQPPGDTVSDKTEYHVFDHFKDEKIVGISDGRQVPAYQDH